MFVKIGTTLQNHWLFDNCLACRENFSFQIHFSWFILLKMLNKLDCENVNGVMLSLSIDVKSEAPKSRNFSITFNSIRRTNRASWYKFSLFLAVLFNIVSIFYVRISLQAIMIILIVLSFLVFFWISHSVQSGKHAVWFWVRELANQYHWMWVRVSIRGRLRCACLGLAP